MKQNSCQTEKVGSMVRCIEPRLITHALVKVSNTKLKYESWLQTMFKHSSGHSHTGDQARSDSGVNGFVLQGCKGGK